MYGNVRFYIVHYMLQYVPKYFFAYVCWSLFWYESKSYFLLLLKSPKSYNIWQHRALTFMGRLSFWFTTSVLPLVISWLSHSLFFKPERKRERRGNKVLTCIQNLTSGLRRHRRATQIESRDWQSERETANGKKRKRKRVGGRERLKMRP